MQRCPRLVVFIAIILLWANIARAQANVQSTISSHTTGRRLADSPPVITTSPVTGTILACSGSASVSPNIGQFMVSASDLTTDLVLDAPYYFELSLGPDDGYGRSITLPQTGGTVSGTRIYVRLIATAMLNTFDSYVFIHSGSSSKKLPVKGTVNALPQIDQVSNQEYEAGASTNPIVFTGTFTKVSWTNDNPSIGLKDGDDGPVPVFKTVNAGVEPVYAKITATPYNASGCAGTPVSFTIKVGVAVNSVVAVSGSVSQLSTVYGTASPACSFKVWGTNLSAGITITPPAGFEVSTDGSVFDQTITVGAVGDMSPAKVYIRLTKNTPVGSYSGRIKLTSEGVTDSSMTTTPTNTVTPALLTVTADNKRKIAGTANPALTVTYQGFVNNETSSVLTTTPKISTAALLSSPPGGYPITATGAASPNYTFTYVDGTLQVTAASVSVLVCNAFTPNGDGINDTWTIKNIENFPKSVVQIYDRYGARVFYSVSYSVAWNGKINGADLPIGIYYYIIDLKNGERPTTGSLTILR